MFVPLISSPSVIWLITGITKVLKNSISRHDLTIDLREGDCENNCKENCAKNAWIFFNPVWYLSQAAFRLIVRCYNFLNHLLFWNFHIKIELIFVYLITWFAFISRIFMCSNLICFQSYEFIHCFKSKFIVCNKHFFVSNLIMMFPIQKFRVFQYFHSTKKFRMYVSNL